MASRRPATSVAELPKIIELGYANSRRDGLRFFVHAGIRPGVPLSQQTQDDSLWIREPRLSSTADYERLIVHGHTVTSSSFPDIKPNRVNLDTRAMFGGPLTAAAFTDSKRFPARLLQATQRLTFLCSYERRR